jgi:hypothetical protein
MLIPWPAYSISPDDLFGGIFDLARRAQEFEFQERYNERQVSESIQAALMQQSELQDLLLNKIINWQSSVSGKIWRLTTDSNNARFDYSNGVKGFYVIGFVDNQICFSNKLEAFCRFAIRAENGIYWVDRDKKNNFMLHSQSISVFDNTELIEIR